MLLHPSMILMIVKDASAIANQMELTFRDWVRYVSIKARILQGHKMSLFTAAV